MPDAPPSSAIEQVNPGEQGFVPAREEMSAEAAGGGQVASQIAGTIGQAAHSLGSGVQLETIRENQVAALQKTTDFMNKTLGMLHNQDPNNLGLLNQPAAQFDANHPEVRRHITDLASQAIDSADNPIERDMIRGKLEPLLDHYDQDIQTAGFAAHKAQQYSSNVESMNAYIQQSVLAKNAHSLVAGLGLQSQSIRDSMGIYYPQDAPETQKLIDNMNYKSVAGWLDGKLHGINGSGGGDWASAQQALSMSEVQSALAQNPAALADYTQQAQNGQSHAEAYNSIGPKWMASMGFDGEGGALDQNNTKWVDNKGAMMAGQKGIKDYFGQQKWEVFSYFAKWGDFPPGLQLSPKMRATFYKQFYNQQDDPRDLAAANDMMLSKKTSLSEYQNFKNTDWTNMDIFPGLSLATRQKFINGAEKAGGGKANPGQQQDATAWSIGMSTAYHYWPTSENLDALTKATTIKGDDGNQHAPIADFLNGMVSYSQAHPGATTIDMSQYADKYMASVLSQNPQLVHLRAQEIAQSRGEDVQVVTNQLEQDLKSNRSGYYGSYR